MTEDSYTHRPGQVEEERGGQKNDDEGLAEEIENPNAPIERGTEEWNVRDWVLVGLIFISFIVIPLTIYIIPPVRPFRFAYLVLPMIPAILLGLVAVWSAQRSIDT